MSNYPTRDIDRTDGSPMYPDGLPTSEERAFMEDHAEARRINQFRDECYEADFMDFREQDTYVGDSTVKSMMWEAAEASTMLLYETGTVYVYDDQDRVVARIQIEQRTPFPFGKKAKQGEQMCVAISSPSEPLDTRHDEYLVDWSRERRLVESENVTEHGGPHAIVAARMWDQRRVAQALAEALEVDPPSLR